MATIVREALNAAGMRLTIFSSGAAYVGLNLSGVWAGSVQFQASTDGINFNAVNLTPWPSGVDVSAATANGNWFSRALNYLAFQVYVPTLTSGAVATALATSNDSSYQNAFLTPQARYPFSHALSATNLLTVAAQANRAWRLRTLLVSTGTGNPSSSSSSSGSPGTGTATAVTWADSPALIVRDGVNIIWGCDLPTTIGPYSVPLPADPGIPGLVGGGVVGTVGNAMTISVASGGAYIYSSIQAEVVPA